MSVVPWISEDCLLNFSLRGRVPLINLLFFTGDSQTTNAIILTDSMSLLQKVKKWNGKPRLKCVNGRHPPLKTPVGVLPWTCRSEGK